jgi:hypothetical protein
MAEQHSVVADVHNADHMDTTWQNRCETCGWTGPLHGMTATRAQLRREADEHAAQFAPVMPLDGEPMNQANPAYLDELRHVAEYRRKRAEWLQAQHDADVAQRALEAARDALNAADEAQELARKVRLAAIHHHKDCLAAVDNLAGELLALVKGEQ